MTGILEMNQNYKFIKMNNEGEQNQNPSIEVLFPKVTTTQKTFLKEKKKVVTIDVSSSAFK